MTLRPRALGRAARVVRRAPPVSWQRDAAHWREATRLWRPAGHFYSPITDAAELGRRAGTLIPTRVSALDVPGVDLRLPAQRALLDVLEPLAGKRFAVTSDEAAATGDRYFTANDSFGAGDATFLRAMLLHARPARLVEVGSGYSSACALDTRDDLGRTQTPATAVCFAATFIEPHPDDLLPLLRPADHDTTTVVRSPVQDVPLSTFSDLESGDVLFVDSTHVAKTGSDVVWLLHEVLPRLRAGVWVHVHDVFPRFEYPLEWMLQGRSWNEAYLLRAFLEFNDSFEIALWPSLLLAVEPDEMLRRFPALAENGGGSFWLRRVR